MNTPISRITAGFLVSAILAACAAQSTTDPTTSRAPSAAASSDAAATSVVPSAAASSVPALPVEAASSSEQGRVSANTATLEEMTAAFASAGVPNPQAWAEEVIGHRPFPTDDMALDQLRRNLLVHDPSDATLAAILGALVP